MLGEKKQRKGTSCNHIRITTHRMITPHRMLSSLPIGSMSLCQATVERHSWRLSCTSVATFPAWLSTLPFCSRLSTRKIGLGDHRMDWDASLPCSFSSPWDLLLSLPSSLSPSSTGPDFRLDMHALLHTCTHVVSVAHEAACGQTDC